MEEVPDSTLALETLKTTNKDLNRDNVIEKMILDEGHGEQIDSAATKTKDATASPFQEKSEIAKKVERKEKEEKEENIPNTSFNGNSNITTDQPHTIIFEDIDANTNNTIHNILKMDNNEETIAEETMKMTLMHDNDQEELETNNELDPPIAPTSNET